jgi:hypothetical protein
MPQHDEILAAARRITGERREATFTADEIVRALPHLNPATIRTHVASRCCVNAPKNHLHKWDYFRRTGRGRYEITPEYRNVKKTHSVAREAQPAYGRASLLPDRATLHGVIARSGKWYAAQCVELPIVTQGRTLDETVVNFRDAVRLHLEGEDLAALNLAPNLALQLTLDIPPFRVSST